MFISEAGGGLTGTDSDAGVDISADLSNLAEISLHC